MWKNKANDLQLLEGFLSNLKIFQHLKEERWEQVEESVQMSNLPGSPSEDWIIPPDENKIRHVLNQDSDYTELVKNLSIQVNDVKKLAAFIGFNTHHKLDWIRFSDPLIGNSALEDATKCAQKLIEACKNTSYFWKNLVHLVTKKPG